MKKEIKAYARVGNHLIRGKRIDLIDYLTSDTICFFRTKKDALHNWWPEKEDGDDVIPVIITYEL